VEDEALGEIVLNESPAFIVVEFAEGLLAFVSRCLWIVRLEQFCWCVFCIANVSVWGCEYPKTRKIKPSRAIIASRSLSLKVGKYALPLWFLFRQQLDGKLGLSLGFRLVPAFQKS